MVMIFMLLVVDVYLKSSNHSSRRHISLCEDRLLSDNYFNNSLIWLFNITLIQCKLNIADINMNFCYEDLMMDFEDPDDECLKI